MNRRKVTGYETVYPVYPPESYNLISAERGEIERRSGAITDPWCWECSRDAVDILVVEYQSCGHIRKKRAFFITIDWACLACKLLRCCASSFLVRYGGA